MLTLLKEMQLLKRCQHHYIVQVGPWVTLTLPYPILNPTLPLTSLQEVQLLKRQHPYIVRVEALGYSNPTDPILNPSYPALT